MKSIRPCQRKSWLPGLCEEGPTKRAIQFWSLPDRLRCRFFIRIFFCAKDSSQSSNANNAPREAQIIKESGRKGAVTVATSMAGRGTDIKLGPGVAELGGLVVVGTERMMNQRIDLQIRGRSGRQGDPGLTKFFRLFGRRFDEKLGPDWIQDTYQDYDVDERIGSTKALTKRKYRNLVERAQNASESSGQASRRMTLEFAESMNIQRAIVYEERDRLIKQEGRLDDIVEKVLRSVFFKRSP